MFNLIVLLLCLPFYITYWIIKLVYNFLLFVINLIFSNKNSNKNIENYENNYNVSNINNVEYTILQSNRDFINNQKVTNNINVKNNIEQNKLIPLTDTELRITVEKIQELYKELGFNVKVIDIIKQKYITEYEIIYSQEITQYDILSVSSEIVDKFQVDGVRIIRDTKKDNRIYIQIPLRYKVC